jgi:hypothetical protein
MSLNYASSKASYFKNAMLPINHSINKKDNVISDLSIDF